MKSNQKGSAFERNLCRQFSLWWTNDENKDVFWRTDQSGGRKTSGNRDTLNYQAGDMTFENPVGKDLIDNIIFEFKKGYDKQLDILALVDSDNKNNIITKWWNKAEAERIDVKRPYAMLVMERNRKKAMCVISSGFYLYLQSMCMFNVERKFPVIEFRVRDKDLLFFRLSHFFQRIDPAIFKKE